MFDIATFSQTSPLEVALTQFNSQEISDFSNLPNSTGVTTSALDLSTNSNDILIGDADSNTISGSAGDDLILGLSGDDILRGNDGQDLLLGGADNDQLEGNFGNDKLWGNNGDDYLNGGVGADTLIGGAGNDILFDDDFGDYFTGGAGQDIFVLGDSTLPNLPKIAIFPPVPDFTITDFQVGEDLIVMNFAEVDDYQDFTTVDTEQGVILSVPERLGLLLLVGVQAADLTPESFLFTNTNFN